MILNSWPQGNTQWASRKGLMTRIESPQLPQHTCTDMITAELSHTYLPRWVKPESFFIFLVLFSSWSDHSYYWQAGGKRKEEAKKKKPTFKLLLRHISISIHLACSLLYKIAEFSKIFSSLPLLLAKIISRCREMFMDLMVVGRGSWGSKWSPLHFYTHTQVGQDWSLLVPGAHW